VNVFVCLGGGVRLASIFRMIVLDVLVAVRVHGAVGVAMLVLVRDVFVRVFVHDSAGMGVLVGVRVGRMSVCHSICLC
jgi:hypothetical protein